MREICTREHPYTPEEKDKFWQHPEAKSIGESWDCCGDLYKCPICGLRFEVEVGQ